MAMEARASTIRKINHKSGCYNVYKKSLSCSIHLLLISCPFFKEACIAALYATLNTPNYSVVCFSLPLGDDLASTTFCYSSTWQSGTKQISISK